MRSIIGRNIQHATRKTQRPVDIHHNQTATMSNTQVGNVYSQIIQDVIDSSRVDFEEGGVDDVVLEELKRVRSFFSISNSIASPLECFHSVHSLLMLLRDIRRGFDAFWWLKLRAPMKISSCDSALLPVHSRARFQGGRPSVFGFIPLFACEISHMPLGRFGNLPHHVYVWEATTEFSSLLCLLHF